MKEATIHFYCLFDESRFSDIRTIMELKEKNLRSNKPCISMNFCTEFSKAQVFHVSIVNLIILTSLC